MKCPLCSAEAFEATKDGRTWNGATLAVIEDYGGPIMGVNSLNAPPSNSEFEGRIAFFVCLNRHHFYINPEQNVTENLGITEFKEMHEEKSDMREVIKAEENAKDIVYMPLEMSPQLAKKLMNRKT